MESAIEIGAHLDLVVLKVKEDAFTRVGVISFEHCNKVVGGLSTTDKSIRSTQVNQKNSKDVKINGGVENVETKFKVNKLVLTFGIYILNGRCHKLISFKNGANWKPNIFFERQ